MCAMENITVKELVPRLYESTGIIKVMNLQTRRGKWYPAVAFRDHAENILSNRNLGRSHGLTRYEKEHGLPLIIDQADVMVSLGTFYNKDPCQEGTGSLAATATKGHLRSLRALAVDVDYHKTVKEAPSPESLYQAILPDLEELQAVPTFIECGHNIRFIYLLEETVFFPADARRKAALLSLLDRITANLTERVNLICYKGQMLNAEPQKLNSFLRLPGTINAKDESTIRWYESGAAYTMESLKGKLPSLPDWYEEWKKKPKHKKRTARFCEGAYDINEIRLSDFRKLAPDLPDESSREVFCHLVFQQARNKGLETDIAMEYAKEYNEMLPHPLPEQELYWCVRTEKVYRYRDETIRKALCLSDEFCREHGLFQGMTKKEKNHRAYLKRRTKMEKKGKTKAAKIQKRREEVQRLREEGLTQKEIAKRLQVSLRVITKDCHELKKKGLNQNAE